MRRAILVTVDGWGTNLVGAYGSPLCETPNLDHFAAHSIVFDRAYASSGSLPAVLQSISNGLHPRQPMLSGPIELAEVLQTLGKQAVFMTDDPEVAVLAWVQSFNESFCFDPSVEEEADGIELVTDWTESRLAFFTEAALGELSKFSEDPEGLPEFTWLHLSGLTRVWDAPYAYRQTLCDEEGDPDPPDGSFPIHFEVQRDTDPDAIFGAVCGAAAQGRLIDNLWGTIETFLDEVVDRKECLVLVAGTRGYPLGEHRSVGFAREEPYAELVHIPLMVQPGGMAIGVRDDSMVQSMSIWASVVDWLSVEVGHRSWLAAESVRRPLAKSLLIGHLDRSEAPLAIPSMCWIDSGDAACLYVPRWSAVWTRPKDSTAFEPELTALYLLPDDRWQQNNVTQRAIEIAETMYETQRPLTQWIHEGCSMDQIPGLPEQLSRPV